MSWNEKLSGAGSRGDRDVVSVDGFCFLLISVFADGLRTSTGLEFAEGWVLVEGVGATSLLFTRRSAA